MRSQMIRDKVDKIQDDLKKGDKNAGQKTIFYDLMASDQLSPEDKTPTRLVAEALGLVAAGYLLFLSSGSRSKMASADYAFILVP